MATRARAVSSGTKGCEHDLRSLGADFGAARVLWTTHLQVQILHAADAAIRNQINHLRIELTWRLQLRRRGPAWHVTRQQLVLPRNNRAARQSVRRRVVP